MEERTVEYWLDIAQYDLDTAEAMWQTKRWLYVAFMCHQCIEKTLKAYWSGTREDDPPYTHNHKRLATAADSTSAWVQSSDASSRPSPITTSKPATPRTGPT